MWLTVAMLVTSALWLAIRAEIEILQNGLPEICGRRLPLPPPPKNYDGTKREALPHSWPWHVGLYYSGFGAYPYCGGTLISPTWVLTAGHCISRRFPCNNIPLGRPFAFDEFTKESLAIKVGSHNFANDHPLAYNVLVKHVILPPNYPLHGRKSGYDFALLKLTREVKRSQTVGFACLPESGFKFEHGQECHVAGWGLIALSAVKLSIQPEVLMEKPVYITSMRICKDVFNPPYSKSDLCVEQSLATHCKGDSGGGLHCPTKDGNWTLYGVLTAGTPRCYDGVGLFGATDAALTWIKKAIQAFN